MFIKFTEVAYDIQRDVWLNANEVSSVCETAAGTFGETIINMKGGESFLVDGSIDHIINIIESECQGE